MHCAFVSPEIMVRTNQQEIARMLNLSQTTVSRSLANHPAINPETKALVLETAAKLGYNVRVKRAPARSEARRTPVWGVLINVPRDTVGPGETFHEILRGISNKSAVHDSVLDVLYHEPADMDSLALLRRIRSAGWKGAILVHPMDPALAHEIANQVACVSIIENYRHDLIDSVDVDQSEAILSVMRLFHAKGHRRIGFLTWVYTVETPWVAHRFGSYVEALYRLGLEFDPRCVINMRPGERLDPKACARRAAEMAAQGVTAFLCAADHQAYSLINDLSAHGIRVPEHISLAGFDGIEPAPGAPQLTTVRVPYDELGRAAVHQLTRRIEQPTAPRRHILVDGDLISGSTVIEPGR